MASPTPAAIQAIRTQVGTITGGFAGNTDPQLADALNAPSVPNPVTTAPQVPQPYTVNDVLGSLSPASVANLKTIAFLPQIRDDVNARNGDGVINWSQILLAGAVITPAEQQAIAALPGRTVPDPAYQTQLSWAQTTLGRPVDIHDVYAARTS